MSNKSRYIKFWLDGCDINFLAIAPADITLEQLLKQCDKIKPDYCACGIKSATEEYGKNWQADLLIEYDGIAKMQECSCTIKE